jgi:hypothetical protein
MLAVSGLALASAAAGCATEGAHVTSSPLPYQTTDEIDTRPARLIGADGDLEIAHGQLLGRLDGGAYNVKLTADSAEGSGPMGRIDVHIKPVAQGFDLSGVWNGGDVHFVIGETGARGRALRQISPEDRGYESCRYDISPLGSSAGYEGLAECLGDVAPVRYELHPKTDAALTREQTAVLLLAYFAAPPPVNVL